MKHLALTILAFLSLMAGASAAAPTASFNMSVQSASALSFTGGQTSVAASGSTAFNIVQSGYSGAFTATTSNSNVAAYISGTTLGINANAAGSTTVTVCDSGTTTCGTLSLTVTSPAVTIAKSGIAVTSDNLNQGASQSYMLAQAGYTGGFTLVSQGTSGITTASLSGTTLTVNAVGAGSSTVVIGGNNGVANASLAISVLSSATTGYTWAPHAEACTTGLQGNAYITYVNYAGCTAIYDANENFLGHIDASGTSSAIAALQAYHSPLAFASALNFDSHTGPGQSNFGNDSAEVLYQNPNLPNVSTTGLWQNTIDCDTSLISYAVYTCNTATGHAINGTSIFVPPNAKIQSTSDHHVGTIGIPCVAYTDARGCERYLWLSQQQPSATSGTTLHVGGGGECPLGPTVANGTDDGDAYYCEGATASFMPVGATNINAAELADAMRLHTYIHHALGFSANKTQSGPIYPSNGADDSTANAPRNGSRWFSIMADSAVDALGLKPAETVILKTVHHMGYFITDTTGGYGPGFNPQATGCSPFTLNVTSYNDPCLAIFTMEGQTDLETLNWGSFNFATELKQCVSAATPSTNYTGLTKPATC